MYSRACMTPDYTIIKQTHALPIVGVRAPGLDKIKKLVNGKWYALFSNRDIWTRIEPQLTNKSVSLCNNLESAILYSLLKLRENTAQNWDYRQGGEWLLFFFFSTFVTKNMRTKNWYDITENGVWSTLLTNYQFIWPCTWYALVIYQMWVTLFLCHLHVPAWFYVAKVHSD